jgi:hypothetical protein
VLLQGGFDFPQNLLPVLPFWCIIVFLPMIKEDFATVNCEPTFRTFTHGGEKISM